MPQIRIRGEAVERSVPLNKQTTSVGRARDNDICIVARESSRRHCLIERGDAGFRVVDLESRNGILVNGQMVREHALVHGDSIQIGTVVLEFEDSDPAEEEAATIVAAPELDMSVTPPEAIPERRFRFDVALLAASTMVLAAGTAMPWHILIEGEGAAAVSSIEWTIGSGEGIGTLACLLLIFVFVTWILAVDRSAVRIRRCLAILFVAVVASLLPSVYLWRTFLTQRAEKGVEHLMGPGIFVALLALVGIGFGASLTYLHERRLEQNAEKSASDSGSNDR